MLFIYTQHGYLYLLIHKCLLFGIICTMTLTPHFFMEHLENNFGVKYSVSAHRVFEVATAFSFTAGHLCMFRTV